ncbi:MAG: histidinol dehydrogenase [Oscillospiraceae bacterium]
MIKIMSFGQVPEEEIFARAEDTADVSGIVFDIIDDVRRNGDSALKKYCKKFDGGAPECLEVSEEEFDEAFSSLEPEFINILKSAAKNIEAFHSRQQRSGFVMNRADGVVLGQRVLPLEKVGLYVPGGTASYPSSVLMNTIPARIAGCGEIIIVSPAKGGKIAPQILAAAKIGGAHRVFKIGGAQAVAALAYGTETVPRVDKIVGPGNAFVAEAKRQVFGKVAIDMIAGPSEILVMADSSADPELVAADLLSQAEHDKNASAVLVTDCEALSVKVSAELEKQIPLLPRADIARASIDNNGKIIITDDLMKAVDAANRIAPEHMEICTEDPYKYLHLIKNAGSVFVGKNCPEAVGDYFAGCNHTLPTGGTARFSSPLSVDDFVKKSQYMYYTEEALLRDGESIAYFAEKEGLSAHARSVTKRLEKGGAK